MKNENSTQHTPGPWKIDPFDNLTEDEIASISDSNDVIIARVKKLQVTHSTRRSKANAQLIASAPDLLKENEQLRKDMEAIELLLDQEFQTKDEIVPPSIVEAYEIILKWKDQ